MLSTYGLYVYVNCTSELCKKGRHLGKYRAVLDVAEAAAEELGPNICAYNDNELEKTLGAKATDQVYRVAVYRQRLHQESSRSRWAFERETGRCCEY